MSLERLSIARSLYMKDDTLPDELFVVMERFYAQAEQKSPFLKPETRAHRVLRERGLLEHSVTFEYRGRSITEGSKGIKIGHRAKVQELLQLQVSEQGDVDIYYLKAGSEEAAEKKIFITVAASDQSVDARLWGYSNTAHPDLVASDQRVYDHAVARVLVGSLILFESRCGMMSMPDDKT